MPIDAGRADWLSLTAKNDEERKPDWVIRFKPWELVTSLGISPSGEILAISAGNRVFIYDIKSRQQLNLIEIGAMTPALSFSPDGSHLAVGSRDGWLRVWIVADLLAEKITSRSAAQPAWQILAHRKGVNWLAYSPDGLFLASAGMDAMARVWLADTGSPSSAIIGGTYAVPGLDFDPSGGILSIVNGSMIRIREINTRRIVGSLRSPTSLYSIDYHPEGDLLAAGDNEHHVYLWDPSQAFRSGDEDYPQPVILEGRRNLTSPKNVLIWRVLFSPDGTALGSAAGDGTIQLWDVTEKKPLSIWTAHSNAVTCMTFSPDGGWLVSGSLDGTVKIWDLDL